jgi:hypothetical protein
MVDWIDIDSRGLREPFFEDTVNRLFRLPYYGLFRAQTTFEKLQDILEQDVPRASPTGFIFHISRCGSTLVSQMLAASDRNVVVSEAPPIDAVVRDPVCTAEHLRWIVNAYAPVASPDRRFFVKFDSWALSHLDLIVSAYPDVPWIFMYREPVEVIVSLMRRPGFHTVPGMIDAAAPSLNVQEQLSLAREDLCARVIGQFCEHGLRAAEHLRAKLINYSQLPEAVTGEIARHFRFEPASDELQAMAEASVRSAKNPNEGFIEDSGAKQAEASDEIRAAADVWVRPFYEKLESLRKAGATLSK